MPYKHRAVLNASQKNKKSRILDNLFWKPPNMHACIFARTHTHTPQMHFHKHKFNFIICFYANATKNKTIVNFKDFFNYIKFGHTIIVNTIKIFLFV